MQAFAAGGTRNPWSAVLTDQQRFECFKALASTAGARYVGSTLENYAATCAEQRKIVGILRTMQSDGIPYLENGGGLMLFGPQGTGKDHLQFAMLRHAVITCGRSAVWRDGMHLQSEIRESIGDGREPAIRERLAEPQILAISDPLPPSGDMSDWNITWIRDVIDRRYRELKSTWFTFNGTSLNDLKQILTPPVLARLTERGTALHCSWPSFRKPAKEF